MARLLKTAACERAINRPPAGWHTQPDGRRGPACGNGGPDLGVLPARVRRALNAKFLTGQGIGRRSPVPLARVP